MRYFFYLVLGVLAETIFACRLSAVEGAAIEADPGHHLYPQIQKIDNDFYMGRIPNKNLWLVMERVNEHNHALWQNYATIQSNPRAIDVASHFLTRGTTGDGSAHFKAVLNEVSYWVNEMWVAYVTKAAFPQKIPNSMTFYSAEYLMGKQYPFAKDIEMFVTVTSNPNALITSHLGIAISVEGAIGQRTKGVSVDLHSFAAKVMLRRNPQRRYMVNAPAFAMEKIIMESLPHAVFVGTREMEIIMRERQSMAFKSFADKKAQKILERLEEEAQEECDRRNRNLERRFRVAKEAGEEGKTEESIRQQAVECLPSYSLVEMGPEGTFVVSKQKGELMLTNKVNEAYTTFKNPYVFPPIAARETYAERFLKVMEQHPPILSVDKKDILRDHFTLFDSPHSAEPWLSVTQTDREYNWMFQRPFKPAGLTHYIAVDLVTLAQSRAVE